MNPFEKIKALIAATEIDAAKCYEKGNKSTGTRLRKAYLEIKKIAATVRSEVSDLKHKDNL